MALTMFYVVSVIFTLVAASVSGVFGFGTFVAIRALLRKIHNR